MRFSNPLKSYSDFRDHLKKYIDFNLGFFKMEKEFSPFDERVVSRYRGNTGKYWAALRLVEHFYLLPDIFSSRSFGVSR